LRNGAAVATVAEADFMAVVVEADFMAAWQGAAAGEGIAAAEVLMPVLERATAATVAADIMAGAEGITAAAVIAAIPGMVGVATATDGEAGDGDLALASV